MRGAHPRMPFFPKAVIFLLIAGAMAYFLDREERRGGFDEVDRQYRSWLMANSEAEIIEPSVTFLGIDDPGVFDQWPPSPVDYSILVENLAKNDPRVIAVTPVLGWQERLDEILLSSMRSVLLRLDKDIVLLGAELMQNPSGETIRPTTLSLFPRLTKVTGDRSQIPEFTQAGSLPDPVLTAIGPTLGFTRIDLGDSEAKRRRDSFIVPLLARHGEEVVASFILMAMVKEVRASLEAVEVDLDGRLVRVRGDQTLEIPIDEGGRLTVHAGIREAVSRESADILFLTTADDIRDQLTAGQKEALLSRIVILGIDDEIARNVELPKDGKKISQAELFAMAIATIQAKRFIQQVSRPVEFGIWGGLGLLGVVMMRLRRKRRLAMWWGVLLILYVVGGLMLFQYAGKWSPIVVPFGVIASILLVGLLLPAAARGASEITDSGAPAGAD